MTTFRSSFPDWLRAIMIACALLRGTVLPASPAPLDLNHWTDVGISPWSSLNAFTAVAGNGTTSVAVGAAGAIATSSADDRNWADRSIESSTSLAAIVWGHHRFVTVGSRGAILNSPDGYTWTRCAKASTEDLQGIAWSGSLYVAVGAKGTILTSPDGIYWTDQTPSPSTDTLSGIAWNGRLFVAVGGSSITIAPTNATVLTSPDGYTWTRRNAPKNIPLFGVAWNGRAFVAVGVYYTKNGREIRETVALTSPDGLAWTEGAVWNEWAFNSAGRHDRVVSDGSQFVLLGSDPLRVSKDGITWTDHPTGIANKLRASCFDRGRWLAVGPAQTIMTSPDLIDWTNRRHFEPSLQDGVWCGDQFVAVGNFGALVTSPDLIEWTGLSRAWTNTHLTSMAWNGQVLVVVGASCDAFVSTDLRHWTRHLTHAKSDRLKRVRWLGGRFVAVGDDGSIVSSPDGMVWTPHQSRTWAALYGLAEGKNGQLIAVGSQGTILQNDNETTWTVRANISTSDLHAVAWNGRRFVAVGQGGALCTSDDGQDWKLVPALGSFDLNDIAWCDHRWVAVGANGAVLTSEDGLSWTIQLVGSNRELRSIVPDHDGFLIVGDSILRNGEHAPRIVRPPVTQTLIAGETAILDVLATGSTPRIYQWFKDGIPIAGATAATLAMQLSLPASSGDYTVRIANSAGVVMSEPARLTVAPTSALSNISFRTSLTNDENLVVGVVVSGAAKDILVRAAGPSLNGFGLRGLDDPDIALYSGPTLIATNDNWPGSLAAIFASVSAFAFPKGSLDAALLRPLCGAFTVQVGGDGPGEVLVEAYDIDGGSVSRLVNLSARVRLNASTTVLIAGFGIAGTGTKQVLVRAIGPGLAAFGLPLSLADPQLRVYDRHGNLFTQNDAWSPALAPAFAQAGAFSLAKHSRDAALLLLVEAGATYTVHATSASGGTGDVLLELYDVF